MFCHASFRRVKTKSEPYRIECIDGGYWYIWCTGYGETSVFLVQIYHEKYQNNFGGHRTALKGSEIQYVCVRFIWKYERRPIETLLNNHNHTNGIYFVCDWNVAVYRRKQINRISPVKPLPHSRWDFLWGRGEIDQITCHIVSGCE